MTYYKLTIDFETGTRPQATIDRMEADIEKLPADYDFVNTWGLTDVTFHHTPEEAQAELAKVLRQEKMLVNN